MNEENYWEQFSTNVGLITTTGKEGDNIMAAAWSYQVSYDPGLIAVCIGPGKVTLDNIEKSKEFGVSLASEEQNGYAHVAGSNSSKDIDKISALKALGCKFVQGKKIKPLLIKDSALAVECKLSKKMVLGDHVMLIGEVVNVHNEGDGKNPLLYKAGKFFKIGNRIEKPGKEELELTKKVIEKNKR